MLPDLRIVIVAVFSTFIFAMSVGFYTSHRLMTEPNKSRSDSLAAFEDSPINRIALNWPEPVQQTSSLDLDFAVNVRASRNPVRDATDDPGAIEPPATPAPAVRETASERVSRIDSPQANAPQKTQPQPSPVSSESNPPVEPAGSEPSPINIIPDNSTVDSKIVEAPVASPPASPSPVEAPLTTGSTADALQTPAPEPEASPGVTLRESDARIATLPDPQAQNAESAATTPNNNLKVRPVKRATQKKAAPAIKRAKKTARRPKAVTPPTNAFPFFSLFQHSTPN